MKKCTKCGEIKEVNLFYKHPKMLDGYDNRCKECVKALSSKREKELRKDPEWCEKERQRSKEKYYRLNYREKSFQQKKQLFWANAEYKDLFRWVSAKIKLTKDQQIHHWNYNRLKDFFVVDKKLHRKIHTWIKVSKVTGLFFTKEGQILSTKADHFNYILQQCKKYGITEIDLQVHDFTETK